MNQSNSDPSIKIRIQVWIQTFVFYVISRRISTRILAGLALFLGFLSKKDTFDVTPTIFCQLQSFREDTIVLHCSLRLGEVTSHMVLMPLQLFRDDTFVLHCSLRLGEVTTHMFLMSLLLFRDDTSVLHCSLTLGVVTTHMVLSREPSVEL